MQHDRDLQQTIQKYEEQVGTLARRKDTGNLNDCSSLTKICKESVLKNETMRNTMANTSNEAELWCTPYREEA
jgi:hypothetical protein